MQVTTTWGIISPRPGFVSAWDAARTAFGASEFDALPRDEQIATVRRYVSSLPAKASTESKRQRRDKDRAISLRGARALKNLVVRGV